LFHSACHRIFSSFHTFLFLFHSSLPFPCFR
jgi:hypothetical protein